MRVSLVSAHYPPNFVSGGTLVPQRVARGLAERGHDVSVFAGRLDDGEAPLTVSRSVDGSIPVTWINITPFTAWTDLNNYDNPGVAAAFAEFVDAARPDVVHFHALQTFGGSLVSIARDAGCRTVVTMHDFWWFCARQFLVDTDMNPCSLVVDAGVCACQAGRASLDERTRVLLPHLAAADVVLAPSRVTAAVLQANGVDAQRLIVDENGMEPAPLVDRVPSDGPVRFRYTGGADPMKGSGVLADAIERLEPDDACRLTVHLAPGADGPLAKLRSGPSVVRADPYRPDELGAILAETDVVVLPSLRETHSIMTREALLAGVPVIASDSLGPEEVIRSGHNGLIVPTGDADALAAAMRLVVDDADLLKRLRAGTAGVAVRTVADQVDGVEAILAHLAAGNPASTAPGQRVRSGPPDRTDPGSRTDPATAAPAATTQEAWTPRRVTFVVGIDGAPLRYRAQFPAEALELVGVATTILHYSDPRVEAAVAAADAVVVYRSPATPRLLGIIDSARRRGVPVVFDVDDLIVDPDVESQIPGLRALPAAERDLWRQGVERYRTTLEHCDAYVGSTAPLVATVADLTGMPAHLKRNAYGLDLARRSDQALRHPRRPGPVRVGYLSGTKTHDEDFRSVLPALCSILDRFDDVEVWLGGHLPDDPALVPYADRVVRIDFRPWTELPALLRQLDVNLAPLSDLGSFNQAKSAIKWLEAALVATPTIARATEPFRTAIEDGVSGVLVDDSAHWEDAIASLITDPVRRRSIGAAARRAALVEWSPHLEGRRYLEILRQVRRTEARGAGSWVDVTVDEAPAAGPVPLTPYPPDVEMPLTVPGPSEPSLRHKLAWSLRNESPARVLRRVARRLAGRIRPRSR